EAGLQVRRIELDGLLELLLDRRSYEGPLEGAGLDRLLPVRAPKPLVILRASRHERRRRREPVHRALGALRRKGDPPEVRGGLGILRIAPGDRLEGALRFLGPLRLEELDRLGHVGVARGGGEGGSEEKSCEQERCHGDLGTYQDSTTSPSKARR